jgi:glycosyltransferase involved in cell wall biosynthesis
MQPLVSVILPTFNRLQYLPAAVDSVRAQSVDNWELIIADDGSDETTRAYLRGIEEPSRVQVLWLAHAGNPGAARNAALGKARGEYIAFLDSDDLWMPHKLEAQLAALRAAPGCRWSYSDHLRINGAGQSINSERNPNRVLYEGDIVEELIRLQAGIPTPTVLAERTLIEHAGRFDEQQGLHEDYDLWLRLALLSKVLVLREPLACVRRHNEHFGSQGVRNFEARLRVFEKAAGRVTGMRQRSVLTAERARNAGGLAGAHAIAGNRSAVLGSIAASWPYSWSNLAWYASCARAVARVLAPRWLVMLVRNHRAGHQAGLRP